LFFSLAAEMEEEEEEEVETVKGQEIDKLNFRPEREQESEKGADEGGEKARKLKSFRRRKTCV
jgi:hypothetical protein